MPKQPPADQFEVLSWPEAPFWYLSLKELNIQPMRGKQLNPSLNISDEPEFQRVVITMTELTAKLHLLESKVNSLLKKHSLFRVYD